MAPTQAKPKTRAISTGKSQQNRYDQKQWTPRPKPYFEDAAPQVPPSFFDDLQPIQPDRGVPAPMWEASKPKKYTVRRTYKA